MTTATTTKMTAVELQAEIASTIIDDVCDFFPRFVGRDDLAAELAATCCGYIESALTESSVLLCYATDRQRASAVNWMSQVKAQIYARLGVKMA